MAAFALPRSSVFEIKASKAHEDVLTVGPFQAKDGNQDCGEYATCQSAKNYSAQPQSKQPCGIAKEVFREYSEDNSTNDA